MEENNNFQVQQNQQMNQQQMPVGNNQGMVPNESKKSKKGLIIALIIIIIIATVGIIIWMISSSNGNSGKNGKTNNDKQINDKKDDDKEEIVTETIDFYYGESNNLYYLKKQEGYELAKQYKCESKGCHVVSKYIFNNKPIIIFDSGYYVYNFDTDTKTKLNVTEDSLKDADLTEIRLEKNYFYYNTPSNSLYAIYSLPNNKTITEQIYSNVGMGSFIFDGKEYFNVKKETMGRNYFIDLSTGEELDDNLLSYVSSYFYMHNTQNVASLYINSHIDEIKANGLPDDYAYSSNLVGEKFPKMYAPVSYEKTENGVNIKYAYFNSDNDVDIDGCAVKHGVIGMFYGACTPVAIKLYNQGKADTVYTIHLSLNDNDYYSLDSITFEK